MIAYISDEDLSSDRMNAKTTGRVDLVDAAAFAAKGTQMRAVTIEDLQAIIEGISDNNFASEWTNRNAMRILELSSTGALRAEAAKEFAFGGENGHAMIADFSNVNFISSAVDAQTAWPQF